ncbi:MULTISPECIES: hypothetical protein [Asanoa]|uniref:Uncharacterized protein n=2 Tax=Asanoa TaxID=195964 RepID=A0A239PH34_9ACTN|nr:MULTISPECIES: hypothetical protein [Asanoa]GIF75684.1 hypothetical protein Asi02nite_52020 [Asanoa siamensis]SNT66282.1 hypothetical protein SAMN05421812_13629 [Asanoa hainanensis]
MTSSTDPRITRVQAAHAAVARAAAVEEQTIRDVHADGAEASAIARHGLGTTGRERVHNILKREPAEPSPPPLTPTIYLRGAGVDDDTWDRVDRAMWARGWATVRDRTSAWHLERGGVPVVYVDFSTNVEVDDHRAVIVQLVRARHNVVERLGTVGSRLEDKTLSELVRVNPDARELLDAMVTLVDQEPELQPRNGFMRGWPYRKVDGRLVLDEKVLARWVGGVLHER